MLVRPRPGAGRLIRRAWRSAQRLGGDLDVLYVADPGGRLSDDEREQLEDLRRLSSALGAELIREEGDDVAATAARVGRERNTTYVLMGQPRAAKGLRRLGASLPERLMERLPGVDVRIVAEPLGSVSALESDLAGPRPPSWWPHSPRWPRPRRRRPTSRLQRQLNELVATEGGPPGVIVTIRRSSGTRVLTAGDGDLPSGRPPRFRDHMRIASVAKAFSAAVALRLVGDREFGLDDTIGELRPDLPRRLARGHRPAPAQPHERAARLHEVGGLRRPASNRPARLRVDERDHLLGGGRAARVPARGPLRVLEHRQHRDRPDRGEGDGPVLRPAAARFHLPSPGAQADELPDAARAPRPVHPRLPGRGDRLRGRERDHQSFRGVGVRGDRVQSARPERVRAGVRRQAAVPPTPAAKTS